MPAVHIVGAGLAGLACGVRLSKQGFHVALYEAAPRAGGRCRSFYDDVLDRVVDNGNHMLLSANRAALGYLAEIDAANTLAGPTEASFPFLDLATGRTWSLRPNEGATPWWTLSRSRRVPGTRASDYLSGLRLIAAGPRATVADCVPTDHPLFRPFWEPLTLAVMNAPPARAAARPLRTVLLRTFARGAANCRPLVASDGLAASFIDPALALLRERGARLQMSRRLRGLSLSYDRARALQFIGELIELSEDDRVVIAVPPSAAADLLPGLTVPQEGEPIINAHFRLPKEPTLPGGAPFLGLLGGTAHWIFLRGDVASVTVSGAKTLVQSANEELIPLLWRDVAASLRLSVEAIPPCRIVKEKRATFVQNPANNRRRPSTWTSWRNVYLAGDWTDTGIPATIEGAVASGHAAARAVQKSLQRYAA